MNNMYMNQTAAIQAQAPHTVHIRLLTGDCVMVAAHIVEAYHPMSGGRSR